MLRSRLGGAAVGVGAVLRGNTEGGEMLGWQRAVSRRAPDSPEGKDGTGFVSPLFFLQNRSQIQPRPLSSELPSLLLPGRTQS